MGCEMHKRKGKIRLILAQIGVFFILWLAGVVFVFSSRAEAAEAAQNTNEIATAAAFIAAGLVTGLGAIGTGIAVSAAASAAIAAVSENEQNFGKSMIFVAMAEGIAIYGLLVAFMILGRV